jgi:hypothetical protein
MHRYGRLIIIRYAMPAVPCSRSVVVSDAQHRRVKLRFVQLRLPC